jgi:hypothetical protein
MRNLLTLALLSSSLLACMNRNDSLGTDSAENAIDSADSTSAEGNLMMASVDGAEGTALVAVTADAAAAQIAANISARYSPAACATVRQTGAAITAIYKDCTGPRGLVHVSGQLDLTIAVSTAGAISAHGTSTGMQVNGATLDIDATGTYTSSGTSHALAVQTTGTGTGARGLAVDHEGNYTIKWDTATQCHSIDGNWSTDLGDRTRANDVSMSRCASGCPTGSITHTFLRGQSVTISFDGSASASWSTSAGASGQVALTCQ